MGGTAAGAWKAAVGCGTGVRYFSSGGHGLERRRLHDPRTGANDRQNPGSTRARLYRKAEEDRKSTRLNSSHGYISYAVFCLKKKNIPINPLSFPPLKFLVQLYHLPATLSLLPYHCFPDSHALCPHSRSHSTLLRVYNLTQPT